MNDHSPAHQHDGLEASTQRLLTGIGSPDLDPGFTQRIARGVEAKQAAATTTTRTPRLIWGLSFATAIAVALIVLATTHHTHVVFPGTPVEQIANRPLPQSPEPLASPSASILVAGRHAATQPHQAALAPKAEAELDPSQAKSFPAPPLPLTQQEKLLLRIAHTGDPVEFAALNAEKRRRVAAQDEEAYLQIFPAPLSAEEEDKLVLKISKGDIQ